jgi:hypothetical protein
MIDKDRDQGEAAPEVDGVRFTHRPAPSFAASSSTLRKNQSDECGPDASQIQYALSAEWT